MQIVYTAAGRGTIALKTVTDGEVIVTVQHENGELRDWLDDEIAY